MAPKKKRKPALNPARGFATVSLPSKAKADDSASEAETVAAAGVATSLSNHDEPQGPLDASESSLAPPSFQNMTADQVELHLEDAELQNKVEKSAERSKREAARQIAKLETERRTLRAQAMPLETEHWLGEALVEEILSLYQSSGAEYETQHPSPQRDRETAQDDLLVKTWTLQQVLRLLHLPHEERVLEHVVSLDSDCHLSSKDYIWGLEESLNWLALHADPDELPPYQPVVPSSRLFRSQRSGHPSSAEGSRTTSPTRPVNNGSRTPVVELAAPTTENQSTTADWADKSAVQPASSAGTDDSTDDDNDPDGLERRYIDTKLQLLKLEPEFQYEENQTKESENEKRLNPTQVARLHRRIETIERDILFDHEKAAAHLNQTLNRLRADISRHRAEWRATNRSPDKLAEPASPEPITEGPGGVYESAEGADGADGADGLFGDMFTLAEPFEPNHKPDAQNEDDDSVWLVDFGKWAGISPRRMLEETCKARDAGCKLSFQLISSSTYSNRHRLQIQWSRHQQQQLSLTALPSKLTYNAGASTFEIEMRSIAASTVLQSEAYISTITLFALCAAETKDEKVFLRLPSVWRELWADLLAQRQAEIDLADKSDLKLIRDMVNNRESQSKRGRRLLGVGAEQINQDDVDSASKKVTKALHTSPEQLRAEWLRKASAPKYQAMVPSRQQLPIAEHRERILKSLSTYQVTILCAETGAGKSTQVPVFILEHELRAGRNCRILVTQPRRISAMSLARRVSEELGEGRTDIGTARSLVGYAIRLESKTTSSTRVTYATTGVLLRMLEASRELENISHLVLDEVHERTLDLDLAFIALRRLLERRPDLKVILMSATVDAEKFSTYFANAPVLTVPGRTYPVEIRYLEDAIEHTVERYGTSETEAQQIEPRDYDDDLGNSTRVKSLTTGLDGYKPKTRAIIASYDEYRVDYALITNLVLLIASHEMYTKYSRAMLIFMPGIAEIRRLHHTFLAHPSFHAGWSFNLLHSSFASEDLEAAFKPPPFGTRKIVIATNIAETGITIPDVTAVIDTCKEKTMRFDERRQMSKLTENFTSKSSCRQRRGRAARVQEGLCFHLVTKYRFDNLLPEEHVPEMLRLSLQEPVLRLKVWGFGNIEQTLAQALDPPTGKNIRRAVDALKDVKALTHSELLTPLGRQLARLPLDIWLGKLAILGVAFASLDAAITIASMMSSKSPFVVATGVDSRLESARLSFQRGDSDLLLNYNAYLAWRRACKSGSVGDFCRRNFLDQQALSQIEDQKVQLLVALGDAGFLSLDEADKLLLGRARLSGQHREFFTIPERYNVNDHSDNVLCSLIAHAFYPRLLVREGKGWRNISTNQQVNLAPTSINKLAARPLQWLSFHQTIQTKSKLPTAFDTSAVPESAIVILLGDAEFKMFAGVVVIDSNKIRFRVRSWRTLMALKILRTKVNAVVTCMIQSPGQPLTSSLQPWASLWQKVVRADDAEVKLQSVPLPPS